MPMRKKASLKQTYLCAVKFWRSAPSVPTLASGVRHVVRKQGFKSPDIYATERILQRTGLLQMSKGISKGVKLTPQGERQARCKSVKLAPWTNPGYPGSTLEAIPRMTPAQSQKRIAKFRKQGCRVIKRRLPSGDTIILKECPKKKNKRR